MTDQTRQLPLCFILMPFGIKPAAGGRSIDFDAIYQQIIAPAVVAAGMEPLRGDQEKHGGVIHKAMYERLILCDYAVADLTSANANVFYELGVRHAVRPSATSMIFAEGFGSLPFDVNGLRCLPYQLGIDGQPCSAESDAAALAAQLRGCREVAGDPATDSPVYQLLQDFPDIQRLKTDLFRDQARYSEQIKSRLADARALAKQDETAALAAVAAVQAELGELAEAEPGVLIDLLLSYRAASGWSQMNALVEAMPALLRNTVLVQEQYGLALNRAKRTDEAERVLLALIEQQGPSSETCGILGRVYKDQWQAAKQANNTFLARGLLKKAIDSYLRGFETDWRDAYPGINALMLMEQCDPPDPRRVALNGVVRYAVERRIAAGQPDYWDYATLLELAALGGDELSASDSLASALALLREPWEAQTSVRNLTLIRDQKLARGETFDDWLDQVIAALNASAKGV
ncbi:MAG: TRAFs-binding domain-containing protein [Halopseudomonas sp.]